MFYETDAAEDFFDVKLWIGLPKVYLFSLLELWPPPVEFVICSNLAINLLIGETLVTTGSFNEKILAFDDWVV